MFDIMVSSENRGGPTGHQPGEDSQMKSSEPSKPKSFRLSRGDSDLWLLLFAIGFFVLCFYSEGMAIWVMRGIMFAGVVFLVSVLIFLSSAKSCKYVVRDVSMASILARIAVLGLWVLYLWRGFQEGAYIDMSLATSFVIAFTILEIVGIRNGRRMPRS